MGSRSLALVFRGVDLRDILPGFSQAVPRLRGLKKNVQGVSLVELLIVLGIVAVVAVGTQGWLATQLPSWRLQGAVRQVVSDLAAAKMKAVVERHQQRIFFQDDHRYLILDDRNNNGKLDQGEDTEMRDIRDRYRDVTVTANNNPSFLPRGTARHFGSITLSNPAGERTITITITGRIKIKAA